MDEPSTSRLLAGRFESAKETRRHALGVVFEAFDAVSQSWCEVTVTQTGRSPAHKEQLFYHLGQLRGVHDEHVLAPFDFGVLPDGTVFTATQLPTGVPLRTMLHQAGALPAPHAAELIVQAGQGLVAAHAQDISHRSLSPDAVLLSRHQDGTVICRVCDFQLLLLTEDFSGQVEEAFAPYICAAHFAEANTDAADVYALGAILSELLYGAALGFAEITDPGLRRRVALPPGLASVVGKALAPLDRERFNTMAEFMAELSPFASGPFHELPPGWTLPDRRSGAAPKGWTRCVAIEPQSETATPIESQRLQADVPAPARPGVITNEAAMAATALIREEATPIWAAPAPAPAPAAAPGIVSTQRVPFGAETMMYAAPPSSGAALATSSSAAPASAPLPRVRVDDDVLISVYRPKTVVPGIWYPLLAYAHLGSKRPDSPSDAPDPVEEVQRRATAALADLSKDYRATTQEALLGLPEGGLIRFVPQVPGVEFNPPVRSFSWYEDIHEEVFKLRVQPCPLGTVLRGRLTAYLDSILLAEVQLSFTVSYQRANPGDTAHDSARAYRKIFASYSHRDRQIVEQFNVVVSTLGDRYLIDVRDLRAGEVWDHRLGELIEQADVFQLFWSSHSMRSPFCRQEWEHALMLSRQNFIRPVYWEEPMPRDDGQGLPPPDLARLHFACLAMQPGTTVVPDRPGSIESTVTSTGAVGYYSYGWGGATKAAAEAAATGALDAPFSHDSSFHSAPRCCAPEAAERDLLAPSVRMRRQRYRLLVVFVTIAFVVMASIAYMVIRLTAPHSNPIDAPPAANSR